MSDLGTTGDRPPDTGQSAYDEELSQPTVPRLGPRRWWLVAALLLVPLTALLVWIGVQNATGVITPRVLGYQVVDDRTVSVTFDVDRPDGWTVSCEVQALDASFGRVGTLQVTLPPDGRAVTRRQVTVRTTSRAVTGTIKRCTRA
ncbi:DUF4307 domain-containing protein [Arsenicicoccus dermatophilus]|uniref:DUF4307 domain-containing protein n=1 Tax=Arsenicicoccus dermatophilus TaxID=1076331 RepID=UPI003916DE80